MLTRSSTDVEFRSVTNNCHSKPNFYSYLNVIEILLLSHRASIVQIGLWEGKKPKIIKKYNYIGNYNALKYSEVIISINIRNISTLRFLMKKRPK